MRGSYPLTWLALLGIVLPALGVGPADLAPTPPMGWNSFDAYGVYLHETAALANVEALAAKLKPYGYSTFVVDNGWFGEYRLQPGTHYPAEKHAADVRLDAYGRFLPSQCYFPHGFAPLVQRCRELGLTFGVHLMRGIPRKAVALDLPIAGTPHTARDIADMDPAHQCRWCPYCYGVDMSRPGAQAWYDGLIRHLADLGVGFLKVDDIVPYPREVEAVATAIARCGRPMVLSLSPGDAVDPNAIAAFRRANMLRVTRDIWDTPADLAACFAAWRRWQGAERPGFWIDMDMIPFGQLQLMSPARPGQAPLSKGDIALAGRGVHRWCLLDAAHKRTFITLRALAASPLMVGGDLPTMDAESLALLTNPDMIACNQNGVMGTLLSEDRGLEVWRTERRGGGDSGWAGVFNRTDDARRVRLDAELLGLSGSPSLRDVWGKRTGSLDGPGPAVTIAAHDVLFVTYAPR